MVMGTAFNFSDIFSSITALVTQVITWMGTWLNAITTNEVLLLFCICLPLFGIGIGVFRRLVHIRA